MRIQANHYNERTTRRVVELSHEQGIEITDSAAVTIASWWQSSGSVGSELAAFASGGVVTREALLDDIHATRVHEGYHDGRMAREDRLALDMLATFVLRYPA